MENQRSSKSTRIILIVGAVLVAAYAIGGPKAGTNPIALPCKTPPLIVAASNEKSALLTDLAAEFVRTRPEVDGTCITVKVVRKDTIEAAGRDWPTIVVQPTIRTSTMFGDGRALVWLADDSTRAIVQIKAQAAVGSITMKLRSYQAR